MSNRIICEHVCPPIPIRDFDWCAHFDSYEPGHPQGYGKTREEAIADLREQAQLREDGSQA